MGTNRTRGRRWIAAVAACGLALGVTACGGDDDAPVSAGTTSAAPAAEKKSEVEKLKVTVFPTSDSASIYAAQEEGVFAKHGLEVEVEEVLTATALTAAVTSGKSDVMHQSLPSAILAISSGLPLKLISGVTQMPTEGYVEVLVPAASEIKEFGDLQGKDVATVSAQGVFDLAARNAIDAAGGDPNDMKSLAMAPTDEAAALEAGRVEAIVLNDPFLIGAKQNEKFRSLGNPFSVLDYEVLSASAYATEKGLREKTSALLKYRDALAEISQQVTEDDQVARDAFAKNSEMDPKVIASLGLPVYSAEVSAQSIDNVTASMEQFGWLKKPISASDVLWTPPGS